MKRLRSAHSYDSEVIATGRTVDANVETVGAVPGVCVCAAGHVHEFISQTHLSHQS